MTSTDHAPRFELRAVGGEWMWIVSFDVVVEGEQRELSLYVRPPGTGPALWAFDLQGSFRVPVGRA